MKVSHKVSGTSASKELRFLSSVHWRNKANQTTPGTNTDLSDTPSSSQPPTQARKSYSVSRKYNSVKRKGNTSGRESVEDHTVTRLLGHPVASPTAKEKETQPVVSPSAKEKETGKSVSTHDDDCTHHVCLPCAPAPVTAPPPVPERDKSNVILDVFRG